MNVQKLVLVNPKDGLMTDSRKRMLDKTGCPQFKGSHASKTWHTKLDYVVPSDIHMFWEGGTSSSNKEEGNVVSTLSIVLVGSATPPDLSQYAATVKKVVFFGHICRMRTALQMVTQLKACETVEFLLGSKEQLELYYFDDDKSSASVSEDNDLVLDGGVNSLVGMVTIKTSVSQSSPSEKATMKEIVQKQIETVLNYGPRMWPSVKRMVVDLPGDGAYLDLVKQYLPMWSGIYQSYGVEMKNSKICLGRKTPDRARRVSGLDNNCHSGSERPSSRAEDNVRKSCDHVNSGDVAQPPKAQITRNEGPSVSGGANGSRVIDPVPVQIQSDVNAQAMEKETGEIDGEQGIRRIEDIKPSLESMRSAPLITNRQEEDLEPKSPFADSSWEASRSPVYCNPSRPSPPDKAINRNETQAVSSNFSQQSFKVCADQSHAREPTLSPVSSLSSPSLISSSSNEEGEVKSQEDPVTPQAVPKNPISRVFTDELAQQFLRRGEMTPAASSANESDAGSSTNRGRRNSRWEAEVDSISTSDSSRQDDRSPQQEGHDVYMGRQSTNENNIVIMGVPEDYSLKQLNDIMLRILPNWSRQITNTRVGLGLRGTRPLKVTLSSRDEVEEAIANAKRFPIYVSESFYLRVGKYRAELDGANQPRQFSYRGKNKRYHPKNRRGGGNPNYRRLQRQRQSGSRSRSRSSSPSWCNSRSRSRSLSRSSRSNY